MTVRAQCLTALLGLAGMAPTIRAQSPAPTIVVDPGHPSEVRSGAAIYHGTSEVHVAWVVAKRLATLLRAEGYNVLMTKRGERSYVSNADRADVGNRAHAALVVRLHCDDGGDSGFAIYHADRTGSVHGHTGPSTEVMRASAAAAESLNVSMARMLSGSLKDGGVRGDSRTGVGEGQGALTGSIVSEVPVVLIEMVTLSNRHDADFIKSSHGQSLMAQAIANGISRYVPASNSPRVR